MDSSRRAVEAYWRSRMIDGVTSDEDKVAPVYKLEEVCELLRSSPAGIVKEVSDYVLKRLDHKSPVVKQKALRLIKFAVAKSGVEFRREMQRHSAVVRQLSHYRGYPDPLKGDALNKAVRETANETVSAIFSSEESKAPPTEGIGNRIEGFGSTKFSRPMEDKRSFISEVVDLGKTSIMQGLSNFASSNMRENDENGNYGSYKSPNLRRTLTSEMDRHDRYEGSSGSWTSSTGGGNTSNSMTWGQDSLQRTYPTASNDTRDGPVSASGKSQEEKLLETIVTPGGVRLQPTRDAILAFLAEASKLNPLPMCYALESKMQSNLWQVRMKAICVLDAILRKKDDEKLLVVSSYFCEHKDCVVKCSQSPQVSLREKASKVLGLLEGENASANSSLGQESASSKDIPAPTALPDLIDTCDPVDYGNEDSSSKHANPNFLETISSGLVIDDLFVSEPSIDTGTSSTNAGENPFADVSFHVTEDKNGDNDLFSGLMVDERSGGETDKPSVHQTSDLADMLFSSNMDQNVLRQADVGDLLAELSVNKMPVQNKNTSADMFTFVTDNDRQNFSHVSDDLLIGGGHSQMDDTKPNILTNSVYGPSQNFILNQPFASQTLSHGTMSNFAGQQQSQFQNFGSFAAGFPHPSVNVNDGNQSSVLPDIFRPTSNSVQSYGSTLNSSKKETKAFDFISDHVSAARGAKKVV